MKATELRIGNWINDQMRGGIIQVDPDDIGTYYHCSAPDPIPLTEEWLLKFGFKNGEHPKFLQDYGIYYSINIVGDKNYKIKNNFYGDNKPIIEIDYVHQFQNLYFALTGEELMVKS